MLTLGSAAKDEMTMLRMLRMMTMESCGEATGEDVGCFGPKAEAARAWPIQQMYWRITLRGMKRKSRGFLNTSIILISE
jgi:hypothetical protein